MKQHPSWRAPRPHSPFPPHAEPARRMRPIVLDCDVGPALAHMLERCTERNAIALLVPDADPPRDETVECENRPVHECTPNTHCAHKRCDAITGHATVARGEATATECWPTDLGLVDFDEPDTTGDTDWVGDARAWLTEDHGCVPDSDRFVIIRNFSRHAFGSRNARAEHSRISLAEHGAQRLRYAVPASKGDRADFLRPVGPEAARLTPPRVSTVCPRRTSQCLM